LAIFPGSPRDAAFRNAGLTGAYLRGAANSLNLYAIDQFRNLGGVKEDSINVSVDYELPGTRLGTFTVGTTGANLLHYQFQAFAARSSMSTRAPSPTAARASRARYHAFASIRRSTGSLKNTT